MELGTAIALLGAAFATFLPGIGSALAVSGTTRASAGVLAEDPSKFGNLLVLQLLPASQALYGLLCGFFIFLKVGLIATGLAIEGMTTVHGIAFLALSMPIAVVGLLSAIYQGKVCVSGIVLISKRPDQQGNAILMATMVEVFALFALLISLLGILFVG